MPLEAPVTTATLPVRLLISSISFEGLGCFATLEQRRERGVVVSGHGNQVEDLVDEAIFATCYPGIGHVRPDLTSRNILFCSGERL